MTEQVYFEDIAEGAEIPQLKKNCSTQQLVLWAAGSGDFYQIHYDKDFATGTGLANIIVHGALKNAFLGQLLHDWAGDAGRIKKYGCQYRGMDYTQQEIICRGVVTAKKVEDGEHVVELEIWTETGEPTYADDGRPRNPAGQKTTPGTAVVVLPSRGS
jgi:acyl dehydratase